MRIVVNNVFCRLEDAPPEVRQALNERYSAMAPGHRYMRTYKLWKKTKGKKGWDGVVRLVDKQQCFLTGMLGQVVSFLAGEIGYEVHIDDQRALPSATSLEATTVQLRDYQDEAVRACCLNEYEGMWWPRGILNAATGSGKCLSPETLVLLYSGETCRADQLRVGEQLMGPDSKPRTVLSLAGGTGPMQRIVPLRGSESWECNRPHVLTLVDTVSSQVLDIPLEEWFRQHRTFRHRHKLYRVAVEFPPRPEPSIDPYFLGVWLGDGTKSLTSVAVTNPDPEILSLLQATAKRWGATVSDWTDGARCPTYGLVTPQGEPNLLRREMRKLFSDGLRIPDAYRLGSRSVRLQLLAGLLDSDGHYDGRGFEIVQKVRALAQDIVFLARSLGFSVSPLRSKVVQGKEYWRAHINGPLNLIPTRVARKKARPRRQKKNHLRTGFRVEDVGVGEYVGFSLDGDGRFLLGDFTVTHNTECAVSLYETLNKPPTLFLVHRKNLLHQTWERFRHYGVHCGRIGDGVYAPATITIATIQTVLEALDRANPERARSMLDLLQRMEMLLVDEAHMVGAKLAEGNQFVRVARLMPNAFFRYGLTGTALMRDRYSDWLLLGTMGEVLSRITAKSLIEQGWLTPPRIIFEHIREPKVCSERWPACYDDGVVLNLFRNKRIVASARAQPKPVIVMTQRIPHAKILHDMLPEFAYLDGTDPTEKRQRVLAGLRGGSIEGLVCTTIFDEGIDLPEIRALELAGAGESAIKVIQRLGRGLRRAAEKDVVIIKDYFDHQSRILRRHSRSRMIALENEGHTIEEVGK